VIKVDKVERRIGLSIKAVGYSEEQLKKESASFEIPLLERAVTSRRIPGRFG
jgi:hypothetical protein